MSERLLDVLQYHGAAPGALAALIVSLDLGRLGVRDLRHRLAGADRAEATPDCP